MGKGQIKLFLGHRHEDRDAVLQLKTKLEELSAEKLSCFQSSAPGEIQAGEEWRERIKRELREADALLLLFKPIVNHVRAYPDRIECDLYLYRVPLDKRGQVALRIPESSKTAPPPAPQSV